MRGAACAFTSSVLAVCAGVISTMDMVISAGVISTIDSSAFRSPSVVLPYGSGVHFSYANATPCYTHAPFLLH